jgi:hypothetical protein
MVKKMSIAKPHASKIMMPSTITTTNNNISNAARSIPVSETDYLDQDPPIRGQNFACVSFVSPEDVMLRKDVFRFHKFTHAISKDLNDLLTSLENTFINVPGAIATAATAATAAISSAVPVVAADSVESEAVESEAVESAAAVAGFTVSSAKDMLDSIRERYAYIFNHDAMQEEYRSFVEMNEAVIDDAFKEIVGFRTSVRGLKIRGVYDSLDEARARAKKIRDFDTNFHVFVAQVGCWCPWSPNPEDIENCEYAEQQLNTLMKDYKNNGEQRNAFYADRKNHLVEKASQFQKQKQDEEEIVDGNKDTTGLLSQDPWLTNKASGASSDEATTT